MPAAQGATMSFGDELASGAFGAAQALRGAPFGEAYNVSQEAQRQDLVAERAEHPIRSTAMQIGGALTQAPLFAAGMGATAALPLGARMLAGAGAGAALGGIEGAGAGSGGQDRLKQGGIGALLGAALGGAVPAVAQGWKAALQKIFDQVNVNRNLGQLGIQRPAADAVTRALSADDALSGAGARNIAAAGPQGMLVDAGPSARGALDTAMQRGGPATLVAREAVNQRGVEANRTLTNALDAALGAPQGVATATSQIRQGSAPARALAYDAAYKAPIDYSSPAARELEGLLKRVPEGAIGKANQLMKLEGHQSNQILANVAADGTITLERLPDVRQIDYITRGLRHLAEAGEDAGKLGGRTDFSRAYTGLSRDIRGKLRELVPQYGTALNTAAEPIEQIQATRLGYEMLRPGMARDEVAMAVQGMSKPERQAVQQGIRSHIDDLMANVKAAASDPNQDAREAFMALRQLNSRAASDKLRTVLDPVQAGVLQKEIDQATKAAELYAGVTKNSATFGRAAVAEANQQLQTPGAVGNLLEGRPLNAMQRGMQFLTGRTPQDKLAKEDEMYRQIAEILTGKRGPDALATLLSLTRAYQTGLQNEKAATAIGAGLGAGSGLAGYQLLRQPTR